MHDKDFVFKKNGLQIMLYFLKCPNQIFLGINPSPKYIQAHI